MSKLLINESPLQVLPALAATIGLNEALFLQQVHYWISDISTFEYDNKMWVYNTYEEWQEQFPFWSTATIKRIIQNLKKLNLLIGKKLSKNKFNKVNYYTINYDQLIKLEKEIEVGKEKNKREKKSKKCPENGTSSGQPKMTQSKSQIDEPNDKVKVTQSCEGQNDISDKVILTLSYNENSQETSSKTSQKNNSSSKSPPIKKIKNNMSEERAFLEFVKYTREEYKPDVDRDYFPTLLKVRKDEKGEITDLKVDLKGRLYAMGAGDISPTKANELWRYMYSHQDQMISIEAQTNSKI